LRGVQLERFGVRDLLDRRHRRLAGRGVQDIADGEAVRDGEDGAFGAGQERAERGGIPGDGCDAAVPVAWRHVLWSVGAGPGTVVGEELALEGTEANVVQACEHEQRDLPTGERELSRLLDALELAHDAEVWRRCGQLLAEAPRLRAAALGQAALHRRVAVRQPLDGELALAVSCQQDSVHAVDCRRADPSDG